MIGQPIPVPQPVIHFAGAVDRAGQAVMHDASAGIFADPRDKRMRQVLVYGFLGLYDGTILNKKEQKKMKQGGRGRTGNNGKA